jgi:hypothetical protein
MNPFSMFHRRQRRSTTDCIFPLTSFFFWTLGIVALAFLDDDPNTNMPKKRNSRQRGAGSNTGIDTTQPNWKSKALRWKSKLLDMKSNNQQAMRLGPYEIVTTCHDPSSSSSSSIPTVDPTHETFDALFKAYHIAKQSTLNDKQLGQLHVSAEIRRRRDDGSYGLFATQPVPKDALVYEVMDSFVFFALSSYTRFLTHLAPPLQCLALRWSYPEDDVVYVRIGEDALVRTSHAHASVNVREDEEDGSLYATRDIAEGEELLKEAAAAAVTDDRTASAGIIEWFEELREELWGQSRLRSESTVNVTAISRKSGPTTTSRRKDTAIVPDFTQEVAIQESAASVLSRHMMVQVVSFLLLCLLWLGPFWRRTLRR